MTHRVGRLRPPITPPLPQYPWAVVAERDRAIRVLRFASQEEAERVARVNGRGGWSTRVELWDGHDWTLVSYEQEP